MKLRKAVSHEGEEFVNVRCPGCGCAHSLRVSGATHPRWDWNGDEEHPTLSPSLLVRYRHAHPPVTPENLDEWKRVPWPQEQREHVCHSFIREGRWEFLSDCTHAFAGQTVDLPEWPA